VGANYRCTFLNEAFLNVKRNDSPEAYFQMFMIHISCVRRRVHYLWQTS